MSSSIRENILLLKPPGEIFMVIMELSIVNSFIFITEKENLTNETKRDEDKNILLGKVLTSLFVNAGSSINDEFFTF